MSRSSALVSPWISEKISSFMPRSVQPKQRTPDMLPCEAPRIDGRHATGIGFDNACRNRLVGRPECDRRFDDQNLLPLGIDAATDELMQAERHLAPRCEHQQVRQ